MGDVGMPITLALFDMAATTVDDMINGRPLVLQAAGLLLPESPVDQVLPDFAYGQVLKVGDTVQDVAEGCNVGALTIAVASGTQTTETLEEAGPTAVLPSVAELPDWLVAHGYVAHQPAA